MVRKWVQVYPEESGGRSEGSSRIKLCGYGKGGKELKLIDFNSLQISKNQGCGQDLIMIPSLNGQFEPKMCFEKLERYKRISVIREDF